VVFYRIIYFCYEFFIILAMSRFASRSLRVFLLSLLFFPRAREISSFIFRPFIYIERGISVRPFVVRDFLSLAISDFLRRRRRGRSG